MNYGMLLCSNVVVIMLLFLPNYASFLHQNCFSNLPKDMYCKSQNMNNPKHWYTPYLLQINIGASGLPSWWTRCHWCIHTCGILELCSCDMQLDHTLFFFGISCIML